MLLCNTLNKDLKIISFRMRVHQNQNLDTIARCHHFLIRNSVSVNLGGTV